MPSKSSVLSLALIAIACVMAGCLDQGAPVPAVEGTEISLTDDNFEAEVLQNDQLTLVDFGTDWCGYCKKLDPIVAYLSVEYDDKLTVGKIDAEESPQAAKEYEVTGYPTMLLFKDGEMIDRMVGFAPYETLSAWVDTHLTE